MGLIRLLLLLLLLKLLFIEWGGAAIGGVAWSLLVGGAICLVKSDNERDSSLLNSSLIAFVSVNLLEGQVAFSHTSRLYM